MEALAYHVERAKDWLRDTCTGEFSGYVLGKDLGIGSADERGQVLADLVALKLIEPVSGRHGQYAKVNSDCETIDWQNAQEAWYPLVLPLDLSNMCGVRPKNIIVVAGETNAGKTFFALQTARMNLVQHQGKHEHIYYFNSEMGADELRNRLQKIDPMPNAWDGLEAYERSREFHSVIRPDGLNIVDYMEVSDKFYLVADWISKIHEKLNKGVCLVCLQKAKGRDTARGGDFTLEKARIALALSYTYGVNVAKITKCKSPIYGDRNPQGQELDYRIVQGSLCEPLTPWRWVTEKERKALSLRYESEQNIKKSVDIGA